MTEFSSLIRRIPVSFALCVTLVPAARAADTVVLSNGDHLSGKVQGLVNGALSFNSDKAGAVTIPVGNVTSVKTDDAIDILLNDGHRIQGKLGSGDAVGKVTITPTAPAGAAPVVVAWTDIRFFNPPVIRWKGNVALGYTTSKTTTSTQTTSVVALAARADESTRTTVNANYQLTSAAGITSQNAGQINAEHDFGLQRRQYGFVTASLQNDDLQRLTVRDIVGAGIGFVTIQSPVTTLRTNFGFSERNENYRHASSDTNLSATLGYQLDTKVGRQATFHHDLTFNPDVANPANNYLRVTFGFIQPLSSLFSFNINEFFDNTSQPPAGVPKNTSSLVVGLGLRF